MARNRMIKPEFWEDDKIAECSMETRLFYIATWNFADDNGIIANSPRWLLIKIFPYDDMSTQDIEKMITKLSDIGRFSCYNIDGKKYILINNFRKHQRIDKPRPTDQPMPTSLQHLGLAQTLTAKIRLEIYNRDGYICQYCGDNLKDEPRQISLDHIIPLTQYGSNAKDNLVTCCKSCNSRKKNRTPVEAGMSFINGRHVIEGQPGVNAGSLIGSPKLKESKLKEANLKNLSLMSKSDVLEPRTNEIQERERIFNKYFKLHPEIRNKPAYRSKISAEEFIYIEEEVNEIEKKENEAKAKFEGFKKQVEAVQ
jgi:hypothetical protein